MAASHADHEERLLVLMPSVRDAERTAQILSEARLATEICADIAVLCAALRRGAGAVLLTEDMLLADSKRELEQALREQPQWSAIPLLVICRESAVDGIHRVLAGGYPSVAVVDRPVRTKALIGALGAALRGRRNQYQVRDALREQERQSRELAARDERLREALAALSKQTAQLRATDRLKDEFLATLAHELRNPLAPITAGLSVLENLRDQQTLEHTLAVMRRQVSHMVRLIDDLLDVSRITTGKLDLKLERFAVRSAIDAAIEATLPSLQRGRHALRLAISTDELYVNADQTRIAQVVSNLLSNACKYTPNGGTIELSVRREGGDVVISVSDNGIGIPPDRLEDIFRMFGQVGRTIDRSQGGLGIGLALVRRLIEMHHGRVNVHSEGAGRGSTFFVRLRAAEGPPAVRRDVATVPRLSSAAKRVLVVDDNEDAGELLGVMLEQEGFEAVIVKDGPAAIEAAGALTPNVVILDIGLPGMSGYEVASRLRQDERLTDTTIIALSGWGSPDDKRRALAAGFDLHLTKPVFVEDLRRALVAVAPMQNSQSESSAP